MPKIACPKCSASYNLPNDLIGKPVKCPKCSTAFKVGKKIKTKTNPAAPQAAKPQSPEEIAKANELKKFGLDGPISKSDAIFDESQSDGTPDPMANPLGRAGFDPGFSSHPPVEEKVDANPKGAMFENPALDTKKTKATAQDPKPKSSKSKGKAGGFELKTAIKEVWFMLLLGLGLLTLVGVLVPLFTSGLGVMEIVGLSIVGVAALAVQVWGGLVAYKHSGSVAMLLLCLLVPFFLLFYGFTNREVMDPALKAYIVCLVLSLVFVPFLFF